MNAQRALVTDPAGDNPRLLARTVEELGRTEAAECRRLGLNGRSYIRANFSKQRVIAMDDDLLAFVGERTS